MIQTSDNVIVITGDGSQTVRSSRFSQHYHSTFGAVTESMHVFIRSGFDKANEIFLLPSQNKKESSTGVLPSEIHENKLPEKAGFNVIKETEPVAYAEKQTTNHSAKTTNTLNILEIGFGTGLNGWLTLIEAEKREIPVHYTAIEAYPLPESVWKTLEYAGKGTGFADPSLFSRLHQATGYGPAAITGFFTLEKRCCELNSFTPPDSTYHLVYFDAFDPSAQPELWTAGVFTKIFRSMVERGILVTYSAKGIVKRALKEAGFIVERLPGPPGKRHILRAVRSAR
jgi:tRNA U34 5-methylaminomethyl-2-thiouridine-forming methyltransferase MnmC